MTYSPSSLSSWLATTEGGPPQIASDAATPPPTKKAKIKKNPDKPSAAKARKIRVYPNARQRELLLKWFKTARWTYNKCLEAIKNNRAKRNKKDLRALLVNNENYAAANQWVLETPYEVRDAAMVELLNAYTSNFAKRNKNKDHQFSVRYRKKKSPQEAIMIRGRFFKKGAFYTRSFGKEPLRAAEPLPDAVDYDCKLVHTRLGHYYLVIPMPLEMASDNQARVEDRVVALDPGVRTFHTAYDPSGSVMEFGKGDIGHIYRICAHMDKLQSRIDDDKTLFHKKRYRMRRAWRKMQWRVRNLVDECHKKIVKFLVANYSVILLPSFETQQMVVRSQRKLNSKAARAMMTWSHYRFKQRLLFKRQEYPWCKVVICDESYTSKTCGQCGKLHHSLGGSKTFKCPSCGLQVDRDAHAARNILLKNASLFGFSA
jgi:putative transposase